MLDSTVRLNDIAPQARRLGFSCAALTDHNVLYGVPGFLKSCKAEGIRPIIGMEADCMYHEEIVPFVLLAKDNAGYADLMRLSSIINVKGHCTPEHLKAVSVHCFIIAYGEGGWLDGELVNGDPNRIREKLEIMVQELPEFDMALSFQEASLWKDRNALLKRLCMSMKIRTCALNKIYYMNRNDSDAYMIMTGIRTQKTLGDPTLSRISGRYMLSAEEMESLYAAEDLRRTDEIALQCTADCVLEKTGLPEYPVPEGLTASQYLTQLCIAGLRKRLAGQESRTYAKRLKYELDVISRMHFDSYFLIVYDFIRYARKAGIYVGPGRGSAAGSLVAYCLGITQIDPLKYNLLFERFLNPERVSMPDIDTDIPDNRREEVIRYVYEKYGADHVADIITFGTLGARQVIRDVARVMNVSQRNVDLIARQIPKTVNVTLAEAWKQSERLRQNVNADQNLTNLWNMAMRLEGLPRHASIHAAGIILSDKRLTDVIPLTKLQSDMYTSQYTMQYLEERGLIKMDFLGLRNLSIIDGIVTKIKADDPSFNIMNIPLDDPKVYDLFAQAETTGVFQFESEGMRSLLRKIRIRDFSEIADALALYRPSSMEQIPQYLENRRNPQNIRYPHPSLEPILKDTYGVLVYQEQVMLTAEKAAGFSLGKADVLRKAMSKKKEEEIRALKDDFVNGCVRNGYVRENAENLFALIAKFGGYGFNKSHAVAYSLVAYQMAYLKAEYPLYFYCSLLDSVVGDENKTIQYIEECRRRKIAVAYPDVNRSEASYIFEDGKIICPLTVVKGTGVRVSDAVITERAKGPYEDLCDFTARILPYKVNRSQISSLIDAGALDGFGQNRRTMKNALDDVIQYAEIVQIRDGDEITLDLGIVSRPTIVLMAENREERSENERNALGFCLGSSPVSILRQKLGIREPQIAELKNMRGPVSGFAVIRSVHTHRTKRGDMMAFLKLADDTGEVDMAVMPELYRQHSRNLMRGVYIRFRAKMSDDVSLLANRIDFINKQ